MSPSYISGRIAGTGCVVVGEPRFVETLGDVSSERWGEALLELALRGSIFGVRFVVPCYADADAVLLNLSFVLMEIGLDADGVSRFIANVSFESDAS